MKKIIATKKQRPCLKVSVPGPNEKSGTIDLYGEGEEIEVRINREDFFKILFKSIGENHV